MLVWGEKMIKCGYVAIVGRANAGKSTLVNTLVGEKVAIVSPKPQTTRDNIIGIMNGEGYQAVLVDTPGIHHSKNKLDKYMMKNVRSAISGVDVIVYLIDGSKPCDDEEREYIEKLRTQKVPLIVVKTKSDKKEECYEKSDIKISSLTGEGIEQLKNKIVFSLSQREDYLFDRDYYTDKSIKFLIGEEIREACLNFFRQEIPHGIAVEITRFDEKKDITIIEANIVCEAERHKGIIIGKGGKNLKLIGQKVRQYAESLLDGKVLLKIFVKVEEGWRDNPNKLKGLGFN